MDCFFKHFWQTVFVDLWQIGSFGFVANWFFWIYGKLVLLDLWRIGSLVICNILVLW